MTASRMAAPFEKCSRIRGTQLGMGWGWALRARGRPETRQGERAPPRARRQHTTTDTLVPSRDRQHMAPILTISPSGRYWTFGPRRAVSRVVTMGHVPAAARACSPHSPSCWPVRVAAPASAQTVEVAPFAGYRFGGDLFELATEPSPGSRRGAGLRRRRQRRDGERALVRGAVHASAGGRRHPRRAVQSAGSNPGRRQSLAGRRPPGPRYGPGAAVRHRVPGAHPLRGGRRRRGPVHARRRRGRQVPARAAPGSAARRPGVHDVRGRRRRPPRARAAASSA